MIEGGLAVGAAFGVTFLMVLLSLHTPLREWFQDNPNARSLHETPVPRLGGLAIWIGVAVGWSILSAPSALHFYAMLVPLIAISLLDDFRGIAPAWRLLVQGGVAAWALISLVPGPWSVGGYTIALLGLVWSANLYNFMDGMDGLAGGMAIFGFSAYAIGAGVAGQTELMWLCATIAAAAGAFLCFNFFPAKIFMGDAGSVPLGFCAGVIGMVGVVTGAWPAWFPVVVFSMFFVDATVTLVKRAYRREVLWHAHRAHYYQRLVLMGWGHRKTALACYGFMLVSATMAVLAQAVHENLRFVMLGALVIVYGTAMVFVDRRWRVFTREIDRD